MLDEQVFDEHPGPPNLAGRDRAQPGELLYGLGVRFEEQRGFREVERGHADLSGRGGPGAVRPIMESLRQLALQPDEHTVRD